MIDFYEIAKELPEVLRLKMTKCERKFFIILFAYYVLLWVILMICNFLNTSYHIPFIATFSMILVIPITFAFTIGNKKFYEKTYRENKLKAYLKFYGMYSPDAIECLSEILKQNMKDISVLPYLSVTLSCASTFIPFFLDKQDFLNNFEIMYSVFSVTMIIIAAFYIIGGYFSKLRHDKMLIFSLLNAQKLAAAGEIEEAGNGEEFYRTIGDFGFTTATVERLNRLWDKEIEREPRSKRRKHNRYKKRFIRENENDGAVTFIAYHKESPIGQATLILSPKSKQVKGLPKCVCNKTVANFAALRIDEEFRGKGLSSVLFDMAEKYARFTEGKSAVTVGVEKDNLRAREIYAHWGFDTLVHITGEEEVLYFKKTFNNKTAE